MKIIKKLLIGIMVLIAIMALVYFAGPRIATPNFTKNLPEVPTNAIALESWLDKREDDFKDIKPGNRAKIVWHGEQFVKTDYAIVYLHGFGASHQEGYPVHQNLADSLGANLFLARQQGHGLKSKVAFKGLTAESYMWSAMEALAIGQQLGNKVILVGTSTGASQAIWLASQHPNLVEALVLFSPYIALSDRSGESLVLGPWGKTIMSMMMGGEVRHEKREEAVAAYWSEDYHLDAYFSLFSMVNESMKPEVFEKVECPVYMAYYYKDEENQDKVVSVAAMKEMFDQLSSQHKKAVSFPNAANHVIVSDLRSKDWRAVQDSTWLFLKDVL